MNAIFWVRVGTVAIALGCCFLVVRHQAKVVATLREFFFRATIPENLGIIRVYFFGVLLLNAWTSPAAWYASLHPSFQVLPRGWQWTKELLPPVLAQMKWIVRLEVVASALAVVGLFTRPAVVVASLGGIIVFGVPCFYFKISHDLHVPELCALVVATSPCGDALSIDAWLRRRRGAPPFAKSPVYTIPIRFCWLLVGTMYLFPGVWKLWEAGDLWLTGTELHVIMYGKWSELPDYYPTIRIDHSPALLVMFGVVTLLFESTFFFAMFNPTTRVVAAVVAASFHLGVGLMMDIWFDPTTPLIALIDLPDLLDRRFTRGAVARIGPLRRWVERKLSDAGGALATTNDSGAAPFLVGSVFVFMMFWTGLTPFVSWPVAAYPLFDKRDTEILKTGDSFEFALRRRDGTEVPLRARWDPLVDTSGIYRLIQKTLDMKSRSSGGFKRYISLIARIVRENNPEMDTKGGTLEVYRFEFPVEPEVKRTTKTHKRQLIAEVDL